MPFCEDCAKYWTPSAMNEDGSCPSCGQTLEAPQRASLVTAKNVDVKKLASSEGDDAKAPWHFKLLVVLTAGYLIWRFIELFT
jgi:hypothetical protein